MRQHYRNFIICLCDNLPFKTAQHPVADHCSRDQLRGAMLALLGAHRSKYTDFLQVKGNSRENPLWILSEFPAELREISAFETAYP